MGARTIQFGLLVSNSGRAVAVQNKSATMENNWRNALTRIVSSPTEERWDGSLIHSLEKARFIVTVDIPDGSDDGRRSRTPFDKKEPFGDAPILTLRGTAERTGSMFPTFHDDELLKARPLTAAKDRLLAERRRAVSDTMTVEIMATVASPTGLFDIAVRDGDDEEQRWRALAAWLIWDSPQDCTHIPAYIDRCIVSVEVPSIPVAGDEVGARYDLLKRTKPRPAPRLAMLIAIHVIGFPRAWGFLRWVNRVRNFGRRTYTKR